MKDVNKTYKYESNNASVPVTIAIIALFTIVAAPFLGLSIAIILLCAIGMLIKTVLRKIANK
ncbi:MAG: hypothetical protein ACRCZZ_11125 [Phocaeicola sp.]